MNVNLGEYKVVGLTVTAAMMSYAVAGELQTRHSDDVLAGLNYKGVFPVYTLPESSTLRNEPYRILNLDEASVREQVNILSAFANNILADIKGSDPDFTKAVDENFWDLM